MMRFNVITDSTPSGVVGTIRDEVIDKLDTLALNSVF